MTKKVALITGASRGIGLSISKKLYEDGFEIFGTSTSGNGDNKYVDHWLKADFSEEKGIDEFLLKLEKISNIYALINNAGINIIKTPGDITIEDYQVIQRVNLEAPFRISQKLAPLMAINNEGKIINIASIWSVVSKTNRSLYSTMKTGLLGMTRALAIDWAKYNILINSISPGFVETELTSKSLMLEEQNSIKNQIPIKRFAQPKEIAEIASFLCSKKNTYLTGQNIIIDGGFTIV
tara:strand:+ start:3306 stop:4016 length:711 start_codon:yes stop_codon:yes gene_type:complete